MEILLLQQDTKVIRLKSLHGVHFFYVQIKLTKGCSDLKAWVVVSLVHEGITKGPEYSNNQV